MDNERAFIARVESADVQTLAQLLRRPTKQQEQALRTYFGDERYRRMHSLALQGPQLRAAESPPGNVVVLHGVMGGELTRYPVGKAGMHFWMNIPRIVWGEFARCRMNDDGRSEPFDIRATGILKRYYGELLLYLASEQWNVRPFWYDWRKDIRISASELESQLRGWFADNERGPVHLVAHSMGGVVARSFMKMYPDRWRQMAARGSKLIMLGTPNFGSFAITQVLTGTESTVRLVALVDVWNSLRDVREIAGTFPGCYQMLPSPEAMPSAGALYQADTWRRLPSVSQRHLQDALGFQQWLNEEIDRELIYIAGCNKPTAGDIRHNANGKPDMEMFRETDFERADNVDLYQFTADGDGTVPHNLGFLKKKKPVFNRVYYIEEEHGRLPVNRQVMQAIDDILRNGETNVLPAKPTTRAARDERQLAAQWKAMHEPAHVTTLANRLSTRARSVAMPSTRSSDALANSVDEPKAAVEPPDSAVLEALPLSSDERKLENAALRSFLFADEDASRHRRHRVPLGDPPTIEVGLVKGSLDDKTVYESLAQNGAPVDCIAVGHYMGVCPQQAELALDRAISLGMLERAAQLSSADGEQDVEQMIDAQRPTLRDQDLILTQFTDRGTLIGQLGQPFLLADPRDDTGQRMIAIAGMGLPGRFGMPELTVLARELCWALGQLGKRHLLTVLIGGGSGNLSTTDAVRAWLRGIAQAVGGAYERDEKRVHRVTFVELEPKRLAPLRLAIEQVVEQLKESLVVTPRLLSDDEIASYETEHQQQQPDNPRRQNSDSRDDAPTRLTVQMIGDAYHFGAITQDASIPERIIKIDPRIVMRSNDMLAAAGDHFQQREQGRFLEKLLIPHDLREHLTSHAPLVLILDRTTARLHWELVAQPDPLGNAAADALDQFNEDSFLGTARGLTRQFRTVLAPPPEPPPPPRRVLRVLVVADPAADAPLPGAELEGIEVADLIESFNTHFAGRTENRVEVERLFGPYEATRENVLKHLMLESWDVLHFAGHCYYNADEPSASGWIFAAKDLEVLSANELNRIDRVPKFVFSNACESGVTPDRAEQRDPRVAPSFAEAFFERGVANFVCTAWPVDDTAARAFARRLYAGLLGLQDIVDNESNATRSATPPRNPRPECMHQAMRAARCEIAPQGGNTWGAYQHYGNPNFRLFDAESFSGRQE